MRRAFTLTELLVVTALLALLAAILFPVVAGVREQARSVQCVSNQRQLGTALLLYAGDWEDNLPVYAAYPSHSPFYYEVLQPYCKSEHVFACPSVTAHWQKGERDYGWGGGFAVNVNHLVRYPLGFHWVPANQAGPRNLAMVPRPAGTLLLADGADVEGRPWPSLYCRVCYSVLVPLPEVVNNWGISDRHRGGANVTFCDGHTRWVLREPLLDWSLERGQSIWGHYDD